MSTRNDVDDSCRSFFTGRSSLRGYGNGGELSKAAHEPALHGDRHVYQHGASVHDERAVCVPEIAAFRAFQCAHRQRRLYAPDDFRDERYRRAQSLAKF